MSTGDGQNQQKASAGQHPATDPDLVRRMQSLGAKLDAVKAAGTKKSADEAAKQATGAPSALGRAFRLSAEFIAGVAAGGLIGWIIDRFTGSSPWGLMIFLMLGFLTGIYNVMRAAARLQAESDKKDGARQ